MSKIRYGAVPVVSRRGYGINATVTLGHIYEADSVSGLSFYHPSHPPYEVSYSGKGTDLDMSLEQARKLRDQLLAMDLGDNDKEK